MILYVDNREPKETINYLNYLNDDSVNKILIELKNLDLGDYIIHDEKNNKDLVLIERKSLSDLEASIKDGRYNEQSFRLSNNCLPNHNIYYLIEGNIINYKNKKFKKILYSCLFSLSYYKGFSVYNSINNIESAEIIYGFVSKMIREKNKDGFYNNETNEMDVELSNNEVTMEDVDANMNDNDSPSDNNIEYTNVVRASKKSNITTDNINVIMLMQIPNVSGQTSRTIMNKFKNIKNLVIDLEKDPSCLDDIRMGSNNRKLGKHVIQSIKQLLLK